MKLSKVFHVISIVVGLIGVFVFLITMIYGSDDSVFGITKFDALLCTVILFLIAIWVQIATIHHMMLEKNGENI